MLNGRCECRAVIYRVPDEFLYALNCHCSNCRAGTGSAFKPFAGIEREKLEVTEGGSTLLVWGDDDSNHTRCGVCGSLLYSARGERPGPSRSERIVNGTSPARPATSSTEPIVRARPPSSAATARGRPGAATHTVPGLAGRTLASSNRTRNGSALGGARATVSGADPE